MSWGVTGCVFHFGSECRGCCCSCCGSSSTVLQLCNENGLRMAGVPRSAPEEEGVVQFPSCRTRVAFRSGGPVLVCGIWGCTVRCAKGRLVSMAQVTAVTTASQYTARAMFYTENARLLSETAVSADMCFFGGGWLQGGYGKAILLLRAVPAPCPRCAENPLVHPRTVPHISTCLTLKHAGLPWGPHPGSATTTTNNGTLKPGLHAVDPHIKVQNAWHFHTRHVMGYRRR